MPEPIDRSAMLSNVAGFYREVLRRDKAGRALAEKLAIHDPQVRDRFSVGYANGALGKTVPSKGALRDFLVGIGVLGPDGQDAALGKLILPLPDAEGVGGLAAIGAERAEALFPPSAETWQLNRAGLASKAPVFVATVREALLFAQAGLEPVPCRGEVPEGLRQHLERHRPDRAYFGAELPALLKVLQRLQVPCFRLALDLPAPPALVEDAIANAQPIEEALDPQVSVRVEESRLRFDCGGRTYELRELAPGEKDRLRVRIRAVTAAAFQVDTIDLYAGRSRASFARLASALFDVAPAAVEADLCLMIRKLETMRAARSARGAAVEAYVMTPDEEADALAFLKRPDLLDQVVRDLEALGYVGEEANKRLGYLITVSRKLDSPLSGVILSRAAAGKSRLMEVLADLVPPEDLVSYTRITPQALYYAADRSLKNKLLISAEDEGLSDSDYALRELISSKRIRLGAPVKDASSGKMKTVQYEVEGPIALLFSTTKPSIHYENATRCFMLSLDESPEQTERVMRFQLKRKTLEGLTGSIKAVDLKRLHRNAQRLLRPLRVVNPFAELLRFPASRIESRREHEKYLSLIEAVAFLRQYQREVKRLNAPQGEVEYIEVTAEDVAEADCLMKEASRDEAELSRPSRRLLELTWQMVEARAKQREIDPRAFQFNRRDIREYTGWSDNQIKAHIKRLEELQFLVVRSGDRGRMYRYELGQDPPATGCPPVGRPLGVRAPGSSLGGGSPGWEVGPDPAGQEARQKEAANA